MNLGYFLLLLLVKSTLGNAKDIYVNSSDDVCLSAGFGCANLTGVFSIRLNNKNIVTDAYSGGKRFTLTVDSSLQNRSSILQTATNYTLCILTVEITDAGLYVFQEEQKTLSYKLFILEKPDIPILTVLDNGTVDIAPAAIECKSTSNSVPTGFQMAYIWFVNGVLIHANDETYNLTNGNTSVITIHLKRADIENKYSCNAAEKYGQSVTSEYSVELFPRIPPLVLIHPNTSIVKVLEHDSLTLSCETISSVPDVTSFSWYGSHDLQQSNNSNTLVLNNITQDLAGTYICSASNGLAINGSESIYVDVLFGPIVEVLSPRSVVDGQHANVTCLLTSNPLPMEKDVVWTKENNSTFQQVGKNLFIPHVNRKDHGIFICTATLALKPSNGSTLIRSASGTVKLSVLYGPTSITLTPSNQSYIVSENSAIGPIYCFAECLPTCQHKWTGPGISSSSETLYFRSISRNQGGLYTCTANNYYGKTEKQIKILILHGPQTVSLSPVKTVVTVNEGDEVGPISCLADCVPSCNFSWSSSKILGYGSQLFIKDVQISQNGTYTCTALNIYGKRTVSVELIVMCKPRLDPKIASSPKTFGLPTGMSLNYRVFMIANPKPSYEWIFRGTNATSNIALTPTSSSYGFEHNTGIYINTITFTHYGTYIGFISNYLGSYVTSFSINRQEKPVAPSAVFVVCQVASIIVMWRSEFDGGSVQTFVIQYRNEKINSTIKNITDLGADMDIVIHDVSPKTTYKVVVVADNIFGRSYSEEMECNTTTHTTNSLSKVTTMFILGISSLAIAVTCFIAIFSASLYHRFHKNSINRPTTNGRVKKYIVFRSSFNNGTYSFDGADKESETNVTKKDVNKQEISPDAYEEYNPRVYTNTKIN